MSTVRAAAAWSRWLHRAGVDHSFPPGTECPVFKGQIQLMEPEPQETVGSVFGIRPTPGFKFCSTSYHRGDLGLLSALQASASFSDSPGSLTPYLSGFQQKRGLHWPESPKKSMQDSSYLAGNIKATNVGCHCTPNLTTGQEERGVGIAQGKGSWGGVGCSYCVVRL